MSIALTAYQGRVGDHNDLAMPGAALLATAIGERIGVEPVVVGTPQPAMNTNWDIELAAAMPGLLELQPRVDEVLRNGQAPIHVLNRCATALATLPIIAKHHPGTVVIWFDAHADLNIPEYSITGYLGGLALSGPAGLWDSGLGNGYALDRVILVGQRDIDPFERDLIERECVTLVEAGADLPGRLTRAIAGRPVFVHVDCDVLDPGIVPTDYLIPDGMSLNDLREAVAAIAEGDVIGLEVTEFQESFAPGGPPAVAEAAELVTALNPLLEALTHARV